MKEIQEKYSTYNSFNMFQVENNLLYWKHKKNEMHKKCSSFVVGTTMTSISSVFTAR